MRIRMRRGFEYNVDLVKIGLHSATNWFDVLGRDKKPRWPVSLGESLYWCNAGSEEIFSLVLIVGLISCQLTPHLDSEMNNWMGIWIIQTGRIEQHHSGTEWSYHHLSNRLLINWSGKSFVPNPGNNLHKETVTVSRNIFNSMFDSILASFRCRITS